MDIKGKIFLAPMAGVADYPFRLLCKEAGADIVCSEMISAKAVLYGDEKTFKLAALRDGERPAGIQLFGSDPAVMAEAARRISSLRPDYIDINMGCPVRKVFSNGEGSALLNDPEKAAAIIEAVVKAAGDIPVSVKMRLGTEKEPTAALRLAGLARESGASFITVHGRTREQMYSGRADLDAIARVVSEARIPVVGNGDITDPESAALMYKKTGCDAIMVGRGALGDPWLFGRLCSARDGIPYVPPTAREKKALILRHVSLMEEISGRHAFAQARKHLAWYTKGLPRSASFRDRINHVDGITEISRLLDELFG